MQYTVCSLQFAVYSVQSTVCSIQCVAFNVQCTFIGIGNVLDNIANPCPERFNKKVQKGSEKYSIDGENKKLVSMNENKQYALHK